jgi:uncharacterized Fe-S center protein
MTSPVYFIPAAGSESQSALAEKSLRVYAALPLQEKIQPRDFIALKIHFGEKGNTGFIKPAWLSLVIDQLKQKSPRVFFTDTNTLYVGRRSNAVEHTQLAFGHGFRQSQVGIPVLIADGLIGRDSESVPVDLPRVKEAKIASAIVHSDVLLCISHFTGHILSGFGAALKNLSMGCASRAGKLEQHAEVEPWIKGESCTLCEVCFDYCPENAIIAKDDAAFILKEKCIGCGECLVVCPQGAVRHDWDNDNARIQEKMAEYAASVHALFKGRAGYLNYLIKMTKDCDCMSKEASAFHPDIGILASLDPVALDKASIDILNREAGRDILREFHDFDWSTQLTHAEAIGFGSTQYQLKRLE